MFPLFLIYLLRFVIFTYYVQQNIEYNSRIFDYFCKLFI